MYSQLQNQFRALCIKTVLAIFPSRSVINQPHLETNTSYHKPVHTHSLLASPFNQYQICSVDSVPSSLPVAILLYAALGSKRFPPPGWGVVAAVGELGVTARHVS